MQTQTQNFGGQTNPRWGCLMDETARRATALFPPERISTRYKCISGRDSGLGRNKWPKNNVRGRKSLGKTNYRRLAKQSSGINIVTGSPYRRGAPLERIPDIFGLPDSFCLRVLLPFWMVDNQTSHMFYSAASSQMMNWHYRGGGLPVCCALTIC